jgi:hypothetical protein
MDGFIIDFNSTFKEIEDDFKIEILNDVFSKFSNNLG